MDFKKQKCFNEKQAQKYLEKEIDLLYFSNDLQDIKRVDNLKRYIENGIFTKGTNHIRLYEQKIDLLLI